MRTSQSWLTLQSLLKAPSSSIQPQILKQIKQIFVGPNSLAPQKKVAELSDSQMDQSYQCSTPQQSSSVVHIPARIMVSHYIHLENQIQSIQDRTIRTWLSSTISVVEFDSAFDTAFQQEYQITNPEHHQVSSKILDQVG